MSTTFAIIFALVWLALLVAFVLARLWVARVEDDDPWDDDPETLPYVVIPAEDDTPAVTGNYGIKTPRGWGNQP